MLEWCLNTKFDIKIIMTCVKIICLIILSDNKYLLEYLRECGIILLLISQFLSIYTYCKILLLFNSTLNNNSLCYTL